MLFWPAATASVMRTLSGTWPTNGKILFVGFGGGGEIGVVRNDGLHFDEVGALRFELIDGRARGVGRRHGDRAGETELAARAERRRASGR